MIAPIAAEMPQTAQSASEPLSASSRFHRVTSMEPDMAFIDDARHTGRPLYATRPERMPRQFYTLAWLAAAVAIWAIVIMLVASQV
jgi:hypothetical protein